MFAGGMCNEIPCLYDKVMRYHHSTKLLVCCLWHSYLCCTLITIPQISITTETLQPPTQGDGWVSGTLGRDMAANPLQALIMHSLRMFISVHKGACADFGLTLQTTNLKFPVASYLYGYLNIELSLPTWLSSIAWGTFWRLASLQKQWSDHQHCLAHDHTSHTVLGGITQYLSKLLSWSFPARGSHCNKYHGPRVTTV